MIDEKYYKEFTKEKYDTICRRTDIKIIQDKIETRYIQEDKIIISKYGDKKLKKGISKQIMKEIEEEYDKIKLKLNEKVTIGDMTLEKIIEKFEKQEHYYEFNISDVYILTIKERTYEQNPLIKIKEIILKEIQSKAECEIDTVHDNITTRLCAFNRHHIFIPDKIWEKIIKALNENKIIVVHPSSMKTEAWIKIWKEGNVYKEKRTYQSEMMYIEPIIYESYMAVRNHVTLREMVHRILLINSFVQLNDATTIIISYANEKQ
jgi:hypothetical protein